MKEIMAIVRINKTNATKKALVEAGVAGFTACKVLGRGRLVKDPALIVERKNRLLQLAGDEDNPETVNLIEGFLDGSRMFPRRLFTILVHDADVAKIVEAIIQANRTDYKVGDGKIFILPVVDAVRVRTGETGEAAI